MQTQGRDPRQGPGSRPRSGTGQPGDRDFEDWVDASADQLMRTALFLTGDRHLAEDLLQDVLERTYLHWRRVQEPAAYARTVMARAVTDRWRRLGRRPREVTLDGSWPGHLPGSDGAHRSDRHPAHDTAARYADQDEVVTALRQLSPRQRAVLVLRYYEDWTEARIADALNCSTGTVKTQASRGLARLRELLSTSRADPPDPTPVPARTSSPVPRAAPTAPAPRPPALGASAPRTPTSPVPPHEERTR